MSDLDPNDSDSMLNFWPSFSDMMLFIVLIFSALMAVTLVLWRDDGQELLKENESLKKEVIALTDSIKSLSKGKGKRPCLVNNKGKTVAWFEIEIHPVHPSYPLHIRVRQVEESADLINEEARDLAQPLLGRRLSVEDLERHGKNILEHSKAQDCRYHAITSIWLPQDVENAPIEPVEKVKAIISENFYPKGKGGVKRYAVGEND